MESSVGVMLLVCFALGVVVGEALGWIRAGVDQRRYGREIERIHASYATVLTVKTNIEQVGSPTIPMHGMETRDEEPEVRAMRAADELAMQRGVESLRQSYLAANIPYTEGQLEDDARRMLNGESPRVPPDLRSFVRDR
jgi:hypothetical protein